MTIRSATALGFVLMLCICAYAQEIDKTAVVEKTSHPARTRSVRLYGKVGADGTKFVEKDSNRFWLVSNAEMLKGYEGQDTVVRGLIAGNGNMIQVQSIRPQISYTARWGDSAFRR